MCSLHYGFVWISERMAGTLFVQLCLKTVLSAHYQAFPRYLFKNIRMKMIYYYHDYVNCQSD